MSKIIILGAGPAGLSAGHELSKNNKKVVIIERGKRVGGISRTEEYKGNFFDIGGHRFFTKHKDIESFWQKTLKDDFLERPRLSRIYYNKKLFNYPLNMGNALKNLGIISSVSVGFSFLSIKIKNLIIKQKENSFEEWIINRFGKKLFNTFFKSYTEKLWGISTKDLSSDWAVQRIKDLSLTRAVKDSLFKIKHGEAKTLIKKFNYPKNGPGMMYEKMAERIGQKKGKILLNSYVDKIRHNNNKIITISVKKEEGKKEEVTGDNFISTLPINKLIFKFFPKPPKDVIKAARSLKFRSFIIVALVIDEKDLFPDNWIYIHEPEVKMIRIQNFKNWSPYMVKDSNKTILGIEYVCWEGDDLWNKSNEDLIDLARKELVKVGLAKKNQIIDGKAVRVADAYPVYGPGHKDNLKIILNYLSNFKNLQTIGRSGMFRYNNMDHSTLTGLYAAKNLMGGNKNIFEVNEDNSYSEGI
jgi:protoporphyrinogen oxidase